MLIPAHVQAKEVEKKAIRCVSKEEIEKRLDTVAEAIHNKLSQSNPVILCVMIGGLIPTASLLLRLRFALEVDYIHLTRYANETVGKKKIQWIAKPTCPLKGRNVLIIEDILDDGLTLAAVVDYCRKEGAHGVYTAVLLDKRKDKRAPGGIIKADFTAVSINSGYVFGYGLDYKGYLRNIAGIYTLAPEHENSSNRFFEAI